jgi:hypothetical protein
MPKRGCRPARVHHRHRAIHQLEQRLVGVTVHDDLGPGERRMQRLRRRVPQLVAVRHHDREAVELELGHLGQARAQLGTVRVPVDGRERSQGLELDQDLRLPHVAGVQDVVDLGEHSEHFGTQQAVRVGDDPQPHRPALPRCTTPRRHAA